MLLIEDRAYGLVAWTQFNPKSKHWLIPNIIGRIDRLIN